MFLEFIDPLLSHFPAVPPVQVQLAQSLGLGGVSLWSVDQDDFLGACGCGKTPLLRATAEEMRGAKCAIPSCTWTYPISAFVIWKLRPNFQNSNFFFSIFMGLKFEIAKLQNNLHSLQCNIFFHTPPHAFTNWLRQLIYSLKSHFYYSYFSYERHITFNEHKNVFFIFIAQTAIAIGCYSDRSPHVIGKRKKYFNKSILRISHLDPIFL